MGASDHSGEDADPQLEGWWDPVEGTSSPDVHGKVERETGKEWLRGTIEGSGIDGGGSDRRTANESVAAAGTGARNLPAPELSGGATSARNAHILTACVLGVVLVASTACGLADAPSVEEGDGRADPDQLVSEGSTFGTRASPRYGALTVLLDGCDDRAQEFTVHIVPTNDDQPILDLGGRHPDEPDEWQWPQVATGPYEVRVQDENGAVFAQDEAFVEGGRVEELMLRPCS